IRPAPSSTLRCLETACTLTGNGSASSLTVASPFASRSRIARRVGSESAANVLSSRAAVIRRVLNQMVEFSDRAPADPGSASCRARTATGSSCSSSRARWFHRDARGLERLGAVHVSLDANDAPVAQVEEHRSLDLKLHAARLAALEFAMQGEDPVTGVDQLL